MGAEVVVVAQSPEFSMDVQSLAYRTGASKKSDVSSWNTLEVNPLIAESIRSEARQATLIEPMSKLCSGLLCPFKVGDDYLYVDYGHFSSKGSDDAVRLYFPLVDRFEPKSTPRNDRDLSGSASAGSTLR
jgi:hypothetical protein